MRPTGLAVFLLVGVLSYPVWAVLPEDSIWTLNHHGAGGGCAADTRPPGR